MSTIIDKDLAGQTAGGDTDHASAVVATTGNGSLSSGDEVESQEIGGGLTSQDATMSANVNFAATVQGSGGNVVLVPFASDITQVMPAQTPGGPVAAAPLASGIIQALPAQAQGIPVAAVPVASVASQAGMIQFQANLAIPAQPAVIAVNPTHGQPGPASATGIAANNQASAIQIPAAVAPPTQAAVVAVNAVARRSRGRNGTLPRGPFLMPRAIDQPSHNPNHRLGLTLNAGAPVINWRNQVTLGVTGGGALVIDNTLMLPCAKSPGCYSPWFCHNINKTTGVVFATCFCCQVFAPGSIQARLKSYWFPGLHVRP